MKFHTAVVFAFFTSVLGTGCVAKAVLKPTKAETILSKMTLDEKIYLLSGDGAFGTRPLPQLGIPALSMTDGPLGVRFGDYTAFPAGVGLGSTFNRQLVNEVSSAIAKDAIHLNRNMLLGPCVNVAHSPLGGRVFESFGEDPFLISELTRSYVRGVQSKGVIATTKHFAANDQEFRRMSSNSVIDERTLREVHLLPFEAAVEEGTGSIMSAYNKLNGAYASENEWLLNNILKKEWGFKGFVVSDWGATMSTVPSANAGLDIEMPWGTYFGAPLKDAVLAGLVPMSSIDEKALRILSTMEQFNLLGSAQVMKQQNYKAGVYQAQPDVALKAAHETFVLLKNDSQLLPLSEEKALKVAFIGSGANLVRSGGGSSFVMRSRDVAPLAGFQQRLMENSKSRVQISHVDGEVFVPELPAINGKYLFHAEKGAKKSGLLVSFFENKDVSGSPKKITTSDYINYNWDWGLPEGVSTFTFSARFEGIVNVPVTGQYEFNLAYDDGARLWIDGKQVVNDWNFADGIQAVHFARIPVQLTAGKDHSIKLEYVQHDTLATLKLGLREPNASGVLENPVEQAVQAAKDNQVAVVFVGLGSKLESEGFDRNTMNLPFNEDDLISKVADANPNTVVVVFAGTPIAMPWKNKVKSILYAWYPGEMGGLALADILLGHVNPSGKLPMSFPVKFEDSAVAKTFPGDGIDAHYNEGVFLGYRHFDRSGVAPLYPFGFGLSYTQFKVDAIKAEVRSGRTIDPEVLVHVSVQNIGDRAGAEVVQVYVAPTGGTTIRPAKELKGFEKVILNPGESKIVSIKLNQRSFAYWDIKSHKWTVDPIAYQIKVGTSSDNLKVVDEVVLK